MVQLRRAGQGPLTSFRNVRQVAIQDVNDVLPALAQGRRSTTLSATATPFIPQHVLAAETAFAESSSMEEAPSTKSLEDQHVEHLVQHKGANDAELLLEPGRASSDLEMTQEDMAPVITLEATAEELEAVTRIKATYARYKLKRQRATEEKAHSKSVRQLFVTCLQSVGEAPWPSTYRKIVFLGVVPHILACLDEMSERARATRSKLQKQLDGANDHTVNYDSFLDRIGKFANLQRASIKLRKQLDPQALSVTLRSESPFDFKATARQLQSLADALGDIGRAEKDLKLVTKAILQATKHSVVKLPKPSLNVDDVDI